MGLFPRRQPEEALPAVPTDLVREVQVIRSAVKEQRLASAWEDMLTVAARVEPTPTYDALVAESEFNPRTDVMTA